MAEVEEKKKELSAEEKKKAEAAKAKKKKKEEEDEPLWQELLANGIKVGVLGWSITMLTLSYVRLPEKLTFGTTIIPIPEQGNIDPTFPASLLGSILAGYGISAGQKKNGNSNYNFDIWLNSEGQISVRRTFNNETIWRCAGCQTIKCTN